MKKEEMKMVDQDQNNEKPANQGYVRLSKDLIDEINIIQNGGTGKIGEGNDGVFDDRSRALDKEIERLVLLRDFLYGLINNEKSPSTADLVYHICSVQGWTDHFEKFRV